MRIQQINNLNFGKIYILNGLKNDSGLYLRNERGNILCEKYEATPLDVDKEEPELCAQDTREMDHLIGLDFNTREKRIYYNEILAEQKNNPVDIFIHSFWCEYVEPERDFLEAAVGRRVIKPRTVWHPSWESHKPSTVDFLTKARKWANLLRPFGKNEFLLKVFAGSNPKAFADLIRH